MTEKIIGRLLCGECNGKKHTMATLVDTADGAVLLSDPPSRPHLGNSREEHPRRVIVNEMVGLEKWSFDILAVPIDCPRHGWVAVAKEFLLDVEAEYRRTGRPVVRILNHPRGT